MSGKTKFQTASDAARGKDRVRAGEDLLETPPDGELALDGYSVDAAGMIEAFDPKGFVEGVGRDGDWEVAPQNMELKEGEQVRGVFLGWGKKASFERVERGVVEINEVNTWRIKNAKTGVTGSFLSSTQLDQKLEGREGHEVVVARGPNIDIGGGKRMAQYLVKSRPVTK